MPPDGSAPPTGPGRRGVLRMGVAAAAAAVVGAPIALQVAAATPAEAASGPDPLPNRLRHLGNARQSVVVTSPGWHSTTGVLTAFENVDGVWTQVLGPASARLGYAGMRPGSQRRQGDGTTPAGSYRISSAFGRDTSPGGSLPYTHITSLDYWWVGDRRSRWYNTLRRASQGGFRLQRKGIDGSEQLYRYAREYRWALVVDFNRPHPVVGRGTGIFVHCSGAGSTAGCVAVPAGTVAWLARWLDPAAAPVITMAPAAVVTDY